MSNIHPFPTKSETAEMKAGVAIYGLHQALAVLAEIYAEEPEVVLAKLPDIESAGRVHAMLTVGLYRTKQTIQELNDRMGRA